MPKHLIDAYTLCPICGSPEYRSQPPGQRHCQGCGHGDFNNPITAVGALILDSKDRVLLIHRAKDPAKGKLGVPGGFVDPYESLEAALHREVAEEIGLKLTSIRYLTSYPNDYEYRGLARPVCDIFFTARTGSFDVTLQQQEVSGWEMLPLGEIRSEELAFDSMRHAVRLLQESVESGQLSR